MIGAARSSLARFTALGSALVRRWSRDNQHARHARTLADIPATMRGPECQRTDTAKQLTAADLAAIERADFKRTKRCIRRLSNAAKVAR